MFLTFVFNRMTDLLKKIKVKVHFFVFLYVVFLIGVSYMLINYSRNEGTILVNGSWTELQDLIFIYSTHLGGGQITLITVVIFALFLSVRKSIVIFSSFIFTAIITQLLKHVVFPDAMRPFIELWDGFKSGDLHLALSEELMKKGNSFPSGHTTSAFSLFIILTLFSKKPAYGLFFGSLAILASYSRVYLAQHFFEDIFLGSIIGILGTLLVYFVFEHKEWLKKLDSPLIKLNR